MKYNKQEVWNKREGTFLNFIPMTQMCRNLPMYEQSCNLWKGKKSTEVIVKTNFSDSKI